MNILGISAYYHDSAAALIVDGQIVAAAQEERFTRKKNDASFPINAINFCLEKSKLKASDIDTVIYYEKPFLKAERIIDMAIKSAPWGFLQFSQSVRNLVKEKIWVKADIESVFADSEILFAEHHQSHAASAFLASPFKEAAFLTMDGVGEYATTSFGVGKENKIDIQQEIHFPDSLGLLYSAFTYYCGFKVNEGEYKLMGMAPYGEPIYKDLIYKEIVHVNEDGSFWLNMKYFNYLTGFTMINKNFCKLFGAPVRKPDTKISQLYIDIAASIQEVMEEIILKLVDHVYDQTGKKNLCLAGGVALNCVANGKILKQSKFDNIWIQPAAGDAGSALGAALFAYYHIKENERIIEASDLMKASLLGPSYSNEEIEVFLRNENIKYEKFEDNNLYEKVSDLINAEKVIGWFQGALEYGPRALGNRSILADPRNEKMQSIVNQKIKFRESFRPFAPAVMEEYVGDYFDLNSESPYMLLVSQVSEKIKNHSIDKGLKGIDKQKNKYSKFPAITHVDCSARIQTVTKERNEKFYKLIETFNNKYACPMLLNTSFNVRGEPIVMTPVDAYNCFEKTNMDFLVLGNYLVGKEDA